MIQAEIVLLFEEADSIFGKRTDVRDSNDRFANGERPPSETEETEIQRAAERVQAALDANLGLARAGIRVTP